MDLSIRSLREDHFPPFERAIDAGVFTVMAAHNEVNGVGTPIIFYRGVTRRMGL